MYNETVSFCKHNTDIIFTRADKGNTTVALNKSIYVKKMEVVFQEIIPCTPRSTRTIKSIENKANSIIKNWYQKEYISKNIMNYIPVILIYFNNSKPMVSPK